MRRFDPYLKTYVQSNEGSRLRSEIADVAQSIRRRNLYSGQPRSKQSQEAIARSLAALKLASETNDRLLLAEACRLMAHALNGDEQYEQSIEYYQKAITLFEGANAGEQAARIRLGYMAALYMTGKYDEAISVSNAAEQWFRTNNHKSGLAKLYANIGNLYYRRGKHVVAVQHHAKAQELFEQLEDWQALAMTYLNLANCFSFIDRLAEAEEKYKMSEELSARLGMQELFMQARYNKSYLMFLKGRYMEALESFTAVRDYFRRSQSQHHVNLCDLDMSEIYLHLRQPAEAAPLATRAAEGFSKTSMRYEHAKALAFSAMALLQIDNLEGAEQAAVASRALFEKEGNKYWMSVVDSCLANVRLARGDVANLLQLTLNKRR